VAETFAFYWLQVKVVLQWKANDYLFQRETHCQRRHGDGWIDGAEHLWAPGALSKMAVNNMIKKVCLAAKVERKVSAHSFRHFYATYLAVKGLDIIKIQTRLGHASLNRTMIYIHYSELVKEDSAKDNPLSGAKTNWTGAVKAWKQMVENEKHKR
jgi:integrase